jgi:stalled ribosome rescue protein Dom34
MGVANIYARHGSNEEQIQNQKNQRMEAYCKEIVKKLENANEIVIFGPSTAKFSLQKKVNATKNLKHITEQVLVTEQMTKEEALRFSEKHYSELAAGSKTVEEPVQEDV